MKHGKKLGEVIPNTPQQKQLIHVCSFLCSTFVARPPWRDGGSCTDAQATTTSSQVTRAAHVLARDGK